MTYLVYLLKLYATEVDGVSAYAYYFETKISLLVLVCKKKSFGCLEDAWFYRGCHLPVGEGVVIADWSLVSKIGKQEDCCFYFIVIFDRMNSNSINNDKPHPSYSIWSRKIPIRAY